PAQALQLVESVRLLLGGGRYQQGGKDLTERRVVSAPTLFDQRLYCGKAFAIRCRHVRPPVGPRREAAVQNQMRYPFWMPDGIGNRHGAALRKSEQRKTAEPGGVSDGFHVAHPRIEGNLVDVPIRQAVAARVVSDQSVILGKPKKEMPRNRQLPIIFEVTKPMRRPQDGRPGTDRRVGQPDAVGRLAITNLLLEVRGRKKSGTRRNRRIEIDRVNLHWLGDVLEILPAAFAIGQIDFALDLIQHLARNADATAFSDAFEPGRNIDPVTEDVGAIRDDVA